MIPPHVGKEYEVVPSEASNAGVRYEVASGEEIPNLGEKLLPVVTAEGSWRGMLSQVADVSKALQSMRVLPREVRARGGIWRWRRWLGALCLQQGDGRDELCQG